MYVIEACNGVLGIHAICHFTSEIWDTTHFTSMDTGYCFQYFVTFGDIHILSYQGLRFGIFCLSKGRCDETFAGEDGIFGI